MWSLLDSRCESQLLGHQKTNGFTICVPIAFKKMLPAPVDPKHFASKNSLLGPKLWSLGGPSPWWIAGAGRDPCYTQKPLALPYDLHLEPSRTDQGPQHTHRIPQHTHHIHQLIIIGHTFPLHATFFHKFPKNYLARRIARSE